MKVVKPIAISILGLATLICAGAAADQPATRPDSKSYSDADINRTYRALNPGKTGGVRYTDEEWDEMMTFMQDNSPMRAQILQTVQLPHDSPIRRDAIRKWRNYLFTKQNFPSIADDLLRHFKLEDDLFYLTLKARTEGGPEFFEIREKIHDKVAQIVDLDLAEQQARIDKLQKLLEDDKTKLAKGQATKDDIVERRTAMIMSRIRKGDSDLVAPATRPAPDSVDEMQAPATLDPAANVSAPANSPAK
jgi:hypothetical protein